LGAVELSQGPRKEEVMTMATAREKELEVINQVSAEELWKHTAYIAEEDRLSGNEGEARAVQYFREFMEDLGFKTDILEIENLISLPMSASLTVLSPHEKSLPCITQSFSITTPGSGLEAELMYVPPGHDPVVAGKIVMREGFASPEPTWTMEHKGAAGQVWINSGELPRNMCISTVWGHPTPETADRLPKTPVVSVNKASGEYLKALCTKGPVRIRLVTETWTDFTNVPLAIAQVEGTLEPDKYLLFNGHIDSWHKGATDNGTANACILEVARVLAKYRQNLRRGVRFVWWSGHSHGRYSGSTWYADHNWEDLHRNAIVHLNVDSLGARGATDYSEVECTAELYQLGRSVIEDYTRQSPRYHRMGHSGDNSFWGIGLPTLFQLLSRQLPGTGAKDLLVGGLPEFWHTEADTIDKVDRDILLKDTQIYAAAAWRLCTAPVLPFNFVDVADEFIGLLSELQQRAGGAFDLAPAVERARALRVKAAELQKTIQEANSTMERASADDASVLAANTLNACIMKLSRLLIPVNYSAVDPFEMDLAIPIPPLPRLQPLVELGTLDRQSTSFKFLERKMLRERTRVSHALSQACELIEGSLAEVAL
jgi:hypothetical protein